MKSSPYQYPLSKNDDLISFHDIETLIQEMDADYREEIYSLKEDLQGQLQDIFKELQALRREMVVFKSGIKI